ncbi:MAG: CbtA family protein [Dongiaceae bacterium]
MNTFRQLFIVALIAGAISGIFVSVVHEIATVPVILAAEVYEGAAEAAPADAAPADATEGEHAGHDHDAEAWAPADGLDRTFYTTLADVLTGIGFALLLVVAYRLRGGPVNWRTGLSWGLAGFVTVIVAPTLGLPLEVPGTEAAPLLQRQIWWICTVVLTGGGLAMILLRGTAVWCLAGLVLIVLPHAIGAPQPAEHGSVAPESIAHQFIVAGTITGLLFWAALGASTGFFYDRLLKPVP